MASDKTNEPTNTYNKFEIGHRFMLSITLWLRFLLVCWAKLWNYLIKMGFKMFKKFAIAMAVIGAIISLVLTNNAPESVYRLFPGYFDCLLYTSDAADE